jgi:hypothetical protein
VVITLYHAARVKFVIPGRVAEGQSEPGIPRSSATSHIAGFRVHFAASPLMPRNDGIESTVIPGRKPKAYEPGLLRRSASGEIPGSSRSFAAHAPE